MNEVAMKLDQKYYGEKAGGRLVVMSVRLLSVKEHP